MRIGIMGGTLDPVHNGHMQLAEAARQCLNLDGVMLLPAGDPPHKTRTASKEDRLAMARLAAQGAEKVFPCEIEIQRNGTTYTVDSLRELIEKNPNTQWFYIIGADTLKVLYTWKDFASVAKMCSFLVCGRADEEVSEHCISDLTKRFGASFIKMRFMGPDISSTDIRRRVSLGMDISGFVPKSVEDYITGHGLYLSSLHKDEILRKLKAALKPERYSHTIGVAETAVRLAKRYGVSPAHAELAALLHDCAKYLPIEQMRNMVKRDMPDVDERELAAESVLHAPAGAILAAQEYGVQHPDILSAIRKHTIGDGLMSALDALIYTADFIEPGRRLFEGLEQARSLAEYDLYAAMCKCAQLTNDFLKTKGEQAHPRTLAMLQHYKMDHQEE